MRKSTPACTSSRLNRCPSSKARGRRCRRVGCTGRRPLLVLLHGTFCETSGTFGKLWLEHPQRVRGAVRSLRAAGIRLRAPDARRQPDRKRADARARMRNRGAAAPASPIPRRPRGGGAGRVCAPTSPRGERPCVLQGRSRIGATRSVEGTRRSRGGAQDARRSRRARRLPVARHAAGVQTTRCVCLGPQVGARACRCSRGAGARGVSSARWRDAARIPNCCPDLRRRFPTARWCAG